MKQKVAPRLVDFFWEMRRASGDQFLMNWPSDWRRALRLLAQATLAPPWALRPLAAHYGRVLVAVLAGGDTIRSMELSASTVTGGLDLDCVVLR